VDSGSSQRYQKDLNNMKTKIITVADVIEFFKTVPPDTKIRVKREYTRNYETTTEFVELVQYGDSIDGIDGIEYRPEYKVIYFGI
jgi:hypothetical protein